MNKATKIKIVTYIKNCVKVNTPADLISDGITKRFHMEKLAVNKLFAEPEVKLLLSNIGLLQDVLDEMVASSEVVQKIAANPPPVKEPKTFSFSTIPPVVPFSLCDAEDHYVYNYYRNLLKFTDDMDTNVNILCKFYKSRMNNTEPDLKIRETLYEYVKTFNLRGLDGADIVADRISVVSRKAESHKHSLAYLVGCMRNAMQYGLLSMNPKVDTFVMDMIEENLHIKLSDKGKRAILGMISIYGVIEVIMLVGKKNLNQESILLNGIELLLRGQEIC